MLDGNCTFNVLVYADADSDVPLEWGDSDAKEVKNAEKVMLRSFSTNSHRIDTLVSYRYVDELYVLCNDQVADLKSLGSESKLLVTSCFVRLGNDGVLGAWSFADGRPEILMGAMRRRYQALKGHKLLGLT
jgi:hypothetical protein